MRNLARGIHSQRLKNTPTHPSSSASGLSTDALLAAPGCQRESLRVNDGKGQCRCVQETSFDGKCNKDTTAEKVCHFPV